MVAAYVIAAILAAVNLVLYIKIRKLEAWREGVCDVCEAASEGDRAGC